MTVEMNPRYDRIAPLVAELGETLLDLYIQADRAALHYGATEVLEILLDTLPPILTGAAQRLNRSTVAALTDVPSVLSRVSKLRRALTDLVIRTEVLTCRDNTVDDDIRLVGLLHDVFAVSFRCLVWGGEVW